MTPKPAKSHAHELIRRAHPPDVADQVYTERVVKRPLYLRPSSPKPSARTLRRRQRDEKNEKAKRRKALQPRPLSAAKKRALGLLEIPKEQRKYAIYEPIHNMWVDYMRDVLGVKQDVAFVRAAGAGPLLASADLHGALLEVVRARCVSRVGLRGIVVRDTQFVFEIITKGNAIKTIPKEHSVFRFEIPVPAEGGAEPPKPLIFEIYGEQFQSRAPDRARKKIKMHYQPDI
ncbi:ribonuclease-like protein P complex subunit Pop4 [Polyplosphaeria fusca]|uniref:Ribonuclease P protein subunit n=1 Tax=Polyplosphaeria fusca TaxID=682080 RepID=A0A9P4V450_9PLEO|nr:ribonuclease-like protein P complex subunit Pop4 [Polyplosphaeria fusca]